MNDPPPFPPRFLPLVAKHIENHYVVYVCSNGMWALGEMALQLTTAGRAEELEPYVEGLVESLARVVNLGAWTTAQQQPPCRACPPF